MGNRKYFHYFYSPTAARQSGVCLVYHRYSRTYFQYTHCQVGSEPENGFDDNYLVFEAPDTELIYLKYKRDQISSYAKGYDLAVAEVKAGRYFSIVKNHHGPVVGTLCQEKESRPFIPPSKAPVLPIGHRCANKVRPFLIQLAAASDDKTKASLLCLARRHR